MIIGEKNPNTELHLSRVFFALGPTWEAEKRSLIRRLSAEGIWCTIVGDNEIPSEGTDGLMSEGKKVPGQEPGAVLLADGSVSCPAHFGIPCFECRRPGEQGVKLAIPPVLTLEGFAEVDARFLEEWLCRALGVAAVIARTGRLLLREIAEDDLEALQRISSQCGSGVLWEEGCFSEDRMRAYIAYAYRLQGFGLWSVLYQGRVIGCCGFGPPEDCPEDETTGPVLELQYMLDVGYQRHGFGTEMCLAALDYARTRLNAKRVVLRVSPDNCASLAFAYKLGFVRKINSHNENLHKNQVGNSVKLTKMQIDL